MTMQVKEERIDPDYQRSGKYAAGTQPDQQYIPPPPVFPAPGTYPAQPTSGAFPTHQISMTMPNNVQPSSKPEETISENQIDFSSVKGIFGWTSIDGVDIPYIFRKDKMFVSVRIVEQKLLNKYPNSYPDDLGKHQPLTSFFITQHECKLLNEINQVHCGGEFGTKLFTIKDLIVLLSDFVEFYNLVKKTFPENEKVNHEDSKKSFNGAECGWLQVNNTVSPYVRRQSDKFVPLSVMKYAAALSIPGSGVLPETEECDLLNKACKIAGFNFTFSKTTRIIALGEIMKSCKIKIMELPMENPLQHAQYIELPTSNNNNQSPEESVPKPEPQNHTKSPSYDVPPSQYPPQMHPAFMDPRMMFSYNRHPYNMYAMQYGPPNVTVNPHQHPMYNPAMGPPPPYMNGQMPGQQGPPGRNRTPEVRPGQSPVRSHSNGSASSTPQPKSPGGLTSPNHFPQMRPQLSPNSYPVPFPSSQGIPAASNRPPNSNMPQNQLPPGHTMMYPNPMVNFMQQRGPFMNQNMRPNMLNGNQHMRPNLPNNDQMPPRHAVRPPTNTHMQPNSQQGMKPAHSSSNSKQPMPPPPSMSGPHQGPMNALQSMVSHQNGNTRYLTQHNNVSQSGHKNVPAGHNPTVANQHSQKLNANSVQNNIQRQSVPNNIQRPSVPNNIQIQSVPNMGQFRKEPNLSVVANGKNAQRQNEHVSNISMPDNKGPEKTINQMLVESIKGVWLGGKSISCMHLDCPGRSGKFCLVEAVCKLYFSGCSVNEFLFALENVLKVPLVTCTDDEEKAFIHYYSLPVTVLKCNKMIDFEDLEKFFPQLSYVFKEKTGNGSSNKSSSQGNHERNDSDVSPEKSNQNFSAMPLTMSEMQHQGQKRPSTAAVSGPPAKSSKRLEDTVQRLLHQQEMSTGCPNGEKQSSGAIIILDD